ncbi:MAG: MFS transporter [Armatimonadetes bacterium]|nr:MFS transporter [Armatimonadota bacterium]
MFRSLKEASKEETAGLFVLLSNRNYALLWTAQLISQVGDRFHFVAISLWIYAVTGSAIAVSIGMTMAIAGTLVVGLVAGALVDRWDRRKTLVGADLVRAGLVAILPVLFDVSIVLVYVDLFLMSLASTFFRPARHAVVPQIVERHHLLPANSFFATVEQGSEVVGPVIAGLLIVRLGYAGALYVDALSYLMSALLIAGTVLPDGSRAEATVADTSSVWQDARDGFQYLWSDGVQRSLFVMLFLGNWVAGLTSLQTPLAKGVLRISDDQFGVFNSVWGMGFILSSLFIGWYGRGIPKAWLIIGGYVGWIGGTAFMGVSPSYHTLLASGFVVGFANIMWVIAVATVLMERTPKVLLGRVIATRQVGLGIVRSGALLAFGVLADVVGVREAIVAMASLSMLLVSVGVWRMPVLRQVD